MGKVKIALAGVGNCASGLVQGLNYYSTAKDQRDAAGLRNLVLAGLHPSDIEVVSAFDIDDRKVGKDLSEAIFAEPNNTPHFAQVRELDVTVQKGRPLDGVGSYLQDIVRISPSPEVNVAQILKHAGAEILVNLLPSGAIRASHWYAKMALDAGCAFVNATPVAIASDPAWEQRFKEANLPVVGDDLIDQVGATTLHRTLLRILSEQGARISKTYQLDVGGGADSLDTLERSRQAKRVAKTKAVQSSLPYEASVVAGTTDYVDFLRNRRDSFLWLKGSYFAQAPMEIEMRLSTIDGPNAGSTLLDVIRAVKVALKRGEAGAILAVAAYAFKNPPKFVPFEKAQKLFEEFLS